MNALNFLNDIKTMIIGDLRDKYIGKLEQVSISSLVEQIKKSTGGLEQLIGKWVGDGSDRFAMYIIPKDSQFEVFNKSERGGKAWLQVHSTLEEAAFDYFDRYLCELRYSAPDSKISSKRK